MNSKKTTNYKDPYTRYYALYGVAFAFSIICFVALIILAVFEKKGIIDFLPESTTLIDILPESTTLCIALCSFFANRILKLHDESKKFESEKKFYEGEIEDFARHLIANINILKELDDDLTKNKSISKIGYIHFSNLKVPHDSILLSNIAMEHTLFDNLKALARLKVNIRNINNSADYLEHLAKNNCDINELHSAIKWEIRRHIGLWIRLEFFEDKRDMPEDIELKKFVAKKTINEKSLKEYLADNMSYPKVDDPNINEINRKPVLEYISKRWDEHFTDREEKRDVLIFE